MKTGLSLTEDANPDERRFDFASGQPPERPAEPAGSHATLLKLGDVIVAFPDVRGASDASLPKAERGLSSPGLTAKNLQDGSAETLVRKLIQFLRTRAKGPDGALIAKAKIGGLFDRSRGGSVPDALSEEGPHAAAAAEIKAVVASFKRHPHLQREWTPSAVSDPAAVAVANALAETSRNMRTEHTNVGSVVLTVVRGLRHDSNNGLAAININVAAVNNRLKSKQGETGGPPGGSNSSDLLASAMRETEVLHELNANFLDVCKLVLGMPLKRQLIDLKEFVMGKAGSMMKQAAEDRKTIEVQVPRSAVEVLTYQAGLSVVLHDLLENSIKYTDMGGRIIVRVARTRGAAIISVRDNGIGIAARYLHRIFTGFRTPEAMKKRDGSGTGLQTVAFIVRGLDGTIDVKSAGRGRGSTFRVRLPLALKAALTPAP